VGANRILTLDDNTSEARLCKDLYYRLRDKLLRSHPWNFAIKRITLGLDIEAPAFEYSHQHILPADCLRILTPYPVDQEWKEESGKILSYSSDMAIKYIWKNEDESSYDVNFAELLAYDLALELVLPLTQNATLRTAIADDRLKCLKETRSYDAQASGSVERVSADTWLQVRY
jgi:hypothetical protein